MKAKKEQIELIQNIFRTNNDSDRFEFKQFNDTKAQLSFSQKDIISSILSGNDTLAIIPTGGGKTLCFQGPSLCFKGLTIVVTPLTALISDQVKTFNKKAFSAYKAGRTPKLYKAIYPGMDELHNSDILDKILHPDDKNTEYKLLYLSPERLTKPKFKRLISEKERNDNLVISHIVIDEAHCLSQWGFDFRESYLNIINFINARPKRPIVSAFTATATPQDIEYIEYLLDFKKSCKKNKYKRFISITPRENLSIKLISCDDHSSSPDKWRYTQLLHIIKQYADNHSILIYCTSVVHTEQLYHQLTKENNTLSEDIQKRTCVYHGQMTSEDKYTNLKKFMSNKCPHIMIATKAFGMGIDKDDIGTIIHYDIPHSLEDYYQEIGRAGRIQNMTATCYLLYAKTYSESDYLGCLSHTIKIIKNDEPNRLTLEQLPIESRLSEASKDTILYLEKYRFSMVIDFISYMKKRSSEEDPQVFINDYLQKGITQFAFDHTKKNLKITLPASMESHSVPELLHDMIAELLSIISGINELYINNTKIANILRWNPNFYELNQLCDTTIKKWDGEYFRKVTFGIHGSKKLTYFDLCVADAIYTIASHGFTRVYTKHIWEILSGDSGVKFSRADSKIKLEIEKSIDRMMNTKISIIDEDIKYDKAPFLPAKRGQDGEMGYFLYDALPIYQYAELLNGELISIPVSLLALHLHKKNKFKPAPFLTDDTAKNYTWKATAENTVLAHYLLHRIFIYKKLKRCAYISFPSLRRILSGFLDESNHHNIGFLNTKILFILFYYDRTEFIPKRENKNPNSANFSVYTDINNGGNKIYYIDHPVYKTNEKKILSTLVY